MSEFTVRSGRRYRATIELGLIESFADNETIMERLSEAGFDDIKVAGSGATRYAEARWPKADAKAELPSQITDVTEVEPA